MKKLCDVKGYKINFVNSTITMNYTFAKASAVVGTPEYNIMKEIKADFPELTKIVKTGREIKKARPTANLTYENMEKYISVQENADELLAIFQKVKTESKTAKSRYKFVRDWFETQFPNFRTATQFIPTPALKQASNF